MKAMNMIDARQHLGELATRAQLLQESTVLTKHGKAIARIAPLESDEELASATAQATESNGNVKE